MVGFAYNQASALDKDTRSGSNIYPGTYVGIVKNNKDGQRAGRLWVYIPDFMAEEENPNSWIEVSYASPFYGISPHEVPQGEQQGELPPVTTYGFWATPPDVGMQVLCTFVKGKQVLGYWFAVVPGLSHSMVPANGAPDGKTPVMDVSPYHPQNTNDQDLSAIQRQPYEPLTQQFTTQGLQEDPVRGPITSSSMRESPSRVFGISSQSTPEAPGHTFVMDDGGEDGTNKLIRIRSSSGNQITMSDDTGMIYLINAQGTGWIELSPSGQIDVFGAAGINMATNGEINLHADKNVNIHAGECVKIVGMKGTKVMGGEELQLHGKKTMIEGVDSLHVHSCTEMMITSFGDIHMKAFNYFCLKGKCFYWNSCTAKEAEQVPPEEPADVSGYQTTVARAPSKEPYKEHDGGQGASGGAPGSEGSGTGPGGMFGGEAGATGTGPGTNSLGDNFSLGFQTGLPGNNVASKSLGDNFSLGFKTGLPGNSVGTGANNWGSNPGQTQPRDVGTSITQPVTSTRSSSMGMSFNSSPSISNPGGGIKPVVVDTTALNNATRTDAIRTSNLANVSTSARTGAPTQVISGTTAQNTITTTNYNPRQTYGGYSGIPETSTPASLTATTSAATGPNKGLAGSDTTQTLTQENAIQSPDMFTSSNPADQAATGRPSSQSPAQEAGAALDQMGGMSPSSDLPPAPGGGGTGCFATGDNCERPADGTGGGGGPGGGAPDNLDTTLGQSPEDLQKTYDQLRDQGLTHEQAIGAMANIQRESGFRPGAIGDNRNSFGIYQFNAPAGRAQGLFNDVPDWQTNAAGQHRYMFTKDSLGRSYAGRSFSSSLQAANDFTNRVEIPRNRASYTAPGGFNSRIVPKLEGSIKRRP